MHLLKLYYVSSLGILYKPGMVIHTYDPCMQEVGAEKS